MQFQPPVKLTPHKLRLLLPSKKQLLSNRCSTFQPIKKTWQRLPKLLKILPHNVIHGELDKQKRRGAGVHQLFLAPLYRKPTNTGRYLNFHSCHSSATKQGFSKGLFLRAERLCSTPVHQLSSNQLNLKSKLFLTHALHHQEPRPNYSRVKIFSQPIRKMT